MARSSRRPTSISISICTRAGSMLSSASISDQSERRSNDSRMIVNARATSAGRLAGLLGHLPDVRRADAVDDVVRDVGGDDLAAQAVALDRGRGTARAAASGNRGRGLRRAADRRADRSRADRRRARSCCTRGARPARDASGRCARRGARAIVSSSGRPSSARSRRPARSRARMKRACSSSTDSPSACVSEMACVCS